MSKKTTSVSTQPALSIIEILIAVSLISIILTALSINMFYTQKSIKDTQLRAKAINQAQSCLDMFRNLHDSSSWPAFCSKIRGSYLVNDKITYGSTVICPAAPPAAIGGGNFFQSTYQLSITAQNESGTACTGSPQIAQVTVVVNYENFSGKPQTVRLSSFFKQQPYDATYIP